MTAAVTITPKPSISRFIDLHSLVVSAAESREGGIAQA
jgi:hypothetical protein